MSEDLQYMIRDNTGAIYGPGNVPTIRQWIAEGRITPDMHVAVQGTGDFMPVSQVPDFTGAFQSAAAAAASHASAPQSPGSPQAQQSYGAANYIQPKATNGLAVASLVCSIVGFMFCGLPAVVGIILGHLARGQIRREPDRYEGAGLATAGMVIGYIVAGLMLAFVTCYILMFVFIFAAAASAPRPAPVFPAPAPPMMPP